MHHSHMWSHVSRSCAETLVTVTLVHLFCNNLLTSYINADMCQWQLTLYTVNLLKYFAFCLCFRNEFFNVMDFCGDSLVTRVLCRLLLCYICLNLI